MTSMSSPTGLYSGGLRWVDPPGAAAGSVKPSDRAGPGPPENSWGAPPLSPAVRGRLLLQLAADARVIAVGRRGPWATGPGRGRAGGARPVPVKPPPALEARASALREHRGDRDSRGRLGQGEAAGAGRSGRDQARCPGRGGPCRGSCASPSCISACRGVEFEQSFDLYHLNSEGMRLHGTPHAWRGQSARCSLD